jgi:hypothetical protein
MFEGPLLEDCSDIFLSCHLEAVVEFDFGVVSVELSGEEPLQGVVERIDPINKEPEGWNVLCGNHEATE